MSGNGREGRGPMGDQRSRADVGPILETWMAAVAPPRAPDRLLEESFARTMVGSQLRRYPWHALRRGGGGATASGRLAGMAFAGLAVALVLAVTAGVVFRPGQGPGGEPSPSPVLSSPSPSFSPSFPPASVGPPASVLALPSPTLVDPTAEIQVGSPMSLATDGSSIWLLADNAHLVRIDPQTNSVAASVTLHLLPDSFQGLAGDPTGLWLTDWNANKILRFDPQTLRSITSIDTVALSKGVLVKSGSVWVASTRGGSVQRIDPATNTIVANISVGPTGPSGPNWLAEGLGSIWVGVPNNGSVVRINELTNAIQATIPVPGPAVPCGGLAVGSTAVWVTSCSGNNLVTQIDPATDKVVGTVDLGGPSYSIALVADRPWISPERGQIVSIDPVRHAIDRVVSPGSGFAGGGDVVVAAGSLWVTDWPAGRVLRLPLAAFGG